jgi:hypothetical protein
MTGYGYNLLSLFFFLGAQQKKFLLTLVIVFDVYCGVVCLKKVKEKEKKN